MKYKTIEDVELKGKRVLVRADFNVPTDGEGRVTDDARIVKTIPTLLYLKKHGARTILMSHLGRPKGTKDLKFTLRHVAEHLAKRLKQPVIFVPDCVGPEAERTVRALEEGQVALLENLRFYPEEEKNDPVFSKSIASLGEIYVDDAFGAAHRAHASTVGVTRFLPAVAGLLLAREIEYFDRALERPERPFAAILGGAKVVDKIKVIENLMTKVDILLIGGAMAYTFLKAQGHGIGSSKFDAEGFETAKKILERAKGSRTQILFPEDHVITKQISAQAETSICGQDIPDGWIGVDIGPKTTARFETVLKSAKTVIWNGPLGIFELKPFSKGTRDIANCLAGLRQATTIIGGGETAAAISELGLEERMSHVSTGGGASLEYLEGTTLPGIDALLLKEKMTAKGKQ